MGGCVIDGENRHILSENFFNVPLFNTNPVCWIRQQWDNFPSNLTVTCIKYINRIFMEYSRKDLYHFYFTHSAEITNITHDICLKNVKQFPNMFVFRGRKFTIVLYKDVLCQDLQKDIVNWWFIVLILCLNESSCINTFAASYLNTQGLNNSCLKSRQRRP